MNVNRVQAVKNRTRVIALGVATAAIIAGGAGAAYAADHEWFDDDSAGTSQVTSVNDNIPFSSQDNGSDDDATFDEEGLDQGGENTPVGGEDPTWKDDPDSEDTYTTDWGDHESGDDGGMTDAEFDATIDKD